MTGQRLPQSARQLADRTASRDWRQRRDRADRLSAEWGVLCFFPALSYNGWVPLSGFGPAAQRRQCD